MTGAATLVSTLGHAAGDRAARVWDALQTLQRNGLVCERTGVIAKTADVSPDTVRRGLEDLERLRWIEPTGLRSGKAQQLRLCVGSPQPAVGSPQLLLVQEPQAAAHSDNGGGYVVPPPSVAVDHRSNRRSIAAADRLTLDPLKKGRGRSDCWQDPADRAYLDAYAGPTEDGLALARAGLEQLFGISALSPETASAGDCDDCGEHSLIRSWIGCFVVCTKCATTRRKAGADEPRPSLPNERTMPTPSSPSSVVLPAGVRLS